MSLGLVVGPDRAGRQMPLQKVGLGPGGGRNVGYSQGRHKRRGRDVHQGQFELIQSTYSVARRFDEFLCLKGRSLDCLVG